MTLAGSQRPTFPSVEPVHAALADPEALEALRRHARARLGVLLADRPVAIREEMVSEAVQDTCDRALKRASEFATERNVSAWVHGILENVLYERCRALRKQPAQPDADPAAWDSVAARMTEPEKSAELMDLLGRLPEEQRSIIVMHHLHEMSHEQIASGLGISVGSSRVRLARAMAEIKRIAAKEGCR